MNRTLFIIFFVIIVGCKNDDNDQTNYLSVRIDSTEWNPSPDSGIFRTTYYECYHEGFWIWVHGSASGKKMWLSLEVGNIEMTYSFEEFFNGYNAGIRLGIDSVVYSPKPNTGQMALEEVYYPEDNGCSHFEGRA
ncbi:MAG: hypothetical protein L6Q29_05370, partial [Candidatus Pacebacteria bacterium]|nr:hypothetical protein [Candidatus Paceibacterota bacterium]